MPTFWRASATFTSNLFKRLWLLDNKNLFEKVTNLRQSYSAVLPEMNSVLPTLHTLVSIRSHLSASDCKAQFSLSCNKVSAHSSHTSDTCKIVEFHTLPCVLIAASVFVRQSSIVIFANRLRFFGAKKAV